MIAVEGGGMDGKGWRKSSHSGNSGGDCVELRSDLAAARDSKNPGVELSAKGLRAFVVAVKRGRF
ncbi:DUF397 domain-containing protein [Actinosynnema sp. NPDC020468]|uniref:DUF397 domain-containing protein n=1 Tax=Actinosynnema sp. NPDC020468 TaxID=3154488 RepID=UPI0033DD3021